MQKRRSNVSTPRGTKDPSPTSSPVDQPLDEEVLLVTSPVTKKSSSRLAQEERPKNKSKVGLSCAAKVGLSGVAPTSGHASAQKSTTTSTTEERRTRSPRKSKRYPCPSPPRNHPFHKSADRFPHPRHHLHMIMTVVVHQ